MTSMPRRQDLKDILAIFSSGRYLPGMFSNNFGRHRLEVDYFDMQDKLQIFVCPIVRKMMQHVGDSGWVADEVGCCESPVLTHAGDTKHGSIARSLYEPGDNMRILRVIDFITSTHDKSQTLGQFHRHRIIEAAD